jgi:hypothetical protein
MSAIPPATLRQERLYTDTFDVYFPVEQQVGADKRLSVAQAGAVEATPTYEDQLGKLFPSSEYNASNMPMGRTLQDNMLTLDRVHFPSGVELRDGCVLQLKTSGHPDEGAWYMTQGNSETWPGTSVRQSTYARVFLKRIVPPANLVPTP